MKEQLKFNKEFAKCLSELINKDDKNILVINNLEYNFNHIYKKLISNFGTIGGEKYLESLLTMDRNNRQGFPFEIFLLLSSLKDYNSKLFNKKQCVWDINNGH